MLSFDVEQHEILKKSGEPDYQKVVSGEGEEEREVWHYDCNRRGDIAILEFQAG